MPLNIPQDADQYEKELGTVNEVSIGDHLVTKEEMLQDPKQRFNYLLQRFFKAGLMRSRNNDTVMRLYFHSIMGTYLKDYSVVKPGGLTDLRVPIIWVQNSSSGKSQLNKYASDVGIRIGLKAVTNTQLTEAGIVGKIDEHKHAWNVKNGLSKGMTKMKKMKSGEELAIQYQDPVIRGDLGKEDIVFIDEGRIIFQPNKHSDNMLASINPALDHPGHIRKKLAHDDAIEYDCSCTLVITSTDFKSLDADLIKQGFFRRCLFINKNMSIKTTREMHGLIGRGVYDDAIYRKTLNEFADAIEKHSFPILRERRRITIDQALLSDSNKAIQRWLGMIETTMYGPELEVMQGLASGLAPFIFKIAGQMAVIKNNILPGTKGQWPNVTFEVNREDMQYAIRLLDSVFLSLMRSIRIGDSPEDQKLNVYAVRIMNEMAVKMKSRKLLKGQVMDILVRIVGCGISKAAKYYDQMVTANYMTEMKIGREIWTMPNWYLWKKEDSVNIENLTKIANETKTDGISKDEELEDGGE